MIAVMEEGDNISKVFIDEKNEIVGKIPTAWLMRSNAAVIGILAMMLCLGVFLPYKDTVTAQMALSTSAKHHVCETYIRSSDYGKIEKGQKAIVSLDIYPRNEFGTLSGHVVWKDDHMYNGKYRVRLDIDSLRLSYGHTAKLLPEMTGMVEIVTSEKPAICKVLPFAKRFLKAKSTNVE